MKRLSLIMKRFSLIICICLVLSSLCFCLGSCNAKPNDTGDKSPITGDMGSGDSNIDTEPGDKEPGDTKPGDTDTEPGDTKPSDVEKYTIIFRQDGEEDVLRTVPEGGTLEDIPQPKPRPGYTVTWEETDFTNIAASIVVNALESANSYTITYNLGVNSYATLDEYTAQVTYDEEFTLKTPSYSGSAPFLGWYLADEQGKVTDEQVMEGKYLYAKDVTLIAKWDEWSPVVS